MGDEGRNVAPERHAGAKMEAKVNDGRTHWQGCWKEHPDCARERVRRLEAALGALYNATGAAMESQEEAAYWAREGDMVKYLEDARTLLEALPLEPQD